MLPEQDPMAEGNGGAPQRPGEPAHADASGRANDAAQSQVQPAGRDAPGSDDEEGAEGVEGEEREEHEGSEGSEDAETDDEGEQGDGEEDGARRLLIVEDDEAFARTLARSFERRGYTVATAPNGDAAAALLEEHDPGYAVVDLKLEGNSSGLACVQLLHQHNPDMLIVVLTGFASIGTAVEAIKLGACQYLAKPSNTDDIEAAFGHVAGSTEVELTNRATSLKTLEWERIHETLAETNFNISEAARRLGMHRRTLARKLEKHRVK